MKVLPLSLFAAATALMILGCTGRPEAPGHAAALRIISLAPSITETIYALGAGDRIVGVSDFCTYPPAVEKLPKVGGYIDPNFEAILRLKPDLLFLLKEHAKVKEFCAARGIRHIEIDDHNVPAIIQSMRIIGSACGKAAEGDKMAAAMDSSFSIGKFMEGPRPRVLLAVGRDGAGSGNIASVWAAGPSTFYDELIRAAGGTNVVSDSLNDYPTLSAEAIIRLKPDIIVDAMSSMAQYADQAQKLMHDWDEFTMVPAVHDSLVFCVEGDYVTIPGPRIIQFLNDLRQIIGKWRDRAK
jgi:iron complex transport system substrate-binding protein